MPPKSADGHGFQAVHEGALRIRPKGVVLLDNQLTVNIFCNEEFVSNIQPAPDPLILKSNGDELIAHHIADVADYDETVWFS